MTIDFHAHPVPDAFRKWLSKLDIDVIADDGFPLPQWSEEAHLQFMDEAGIDYTVLSLPTPHIYPCDADMPTDGGTTLLPLYRGEAPLTRKIFAFWPESSDSSLQWEFAEALRQNIK